MAKSSDIIKIGFDYRASLEQFEKETNGVFDGISEKAGKQRISIQLDAKNDKVIEKIKELQKLKLDKFTFEFGESGLAEQLKTFDQLEKKINEIINLSKGLGDVVAKTDFGTKNKTEAYNQLKQMADAFKKFYGNEEAMHSKAGTDAAYAYYKAYEEALKKGVAQSRLESVTVDVDPDGFYDASRLSSDRIKDFESFKKYGGDITDLSSEILSLEGKLLDFADAYTKVKTTLGDAPITPDIIQNIEYYVELLGKARSLESWGDENDKETISSHRDSAQFWLDDALYKAKIQNEDYVASLKEVREEKEKTDEAIAHSSTPTVDDSKFDELKADVTEIREELNGVKEKISAIDSEGFEHVKADVEKTVESVRELNSELTEVKSKLDNTSASPVETNISSPMKDTFQGDKIEQATTSAKELDKTLEAVEIPKESFDEVISKFNIIEEKAKNIVKITKDMHRDSDGKPIESYNVTYKDGSNESYGESSNPQLLRSKDVLYDAKESEKKAQAEQKVAEAMAKGREQSEKARQSEQKRQELAQNKAINKALEQEYQERQKVAEASRKQAELDKQNALAFTKSASERLSSAISKYSYGDASDATAMMKQMNRGLSNFGDLSNIQGNIEKLSSSVDKIISDLQLSHEQSLSALKQEIKEEEVLQSQKDAFHKKNLNAIDMEIKKREEESSTYAKTLKSQMEERYSAISSMEKSLDNYNSKLEKFSVKPTDGNRYPVYQQQIDNLTKKIGELDTLKNNLSKKDIIDESDMKSVNALQQEIDELILKMNNMSAGERGFDPLGADKALEKINSELKKNSAMSKEAKRQIQGFYDEIRSGNPSKPIKDLLDDMYKLIQAERLAGREGKSFMDIFKEKVIYGAAANMAGMIGIYDVINVGRQATDIVIDLNTQITELAKVSEATSSQIYDDFNSYAEIAKEVGGTISDTISATADWSRNGYNIPDSKELAEVAMIYKNVGDGIDIDQANEYLISTLRGFNLEAKDAMSIIDSMNEVANNEPISASGIGEALQRSAAAFNAANTSLQESIALVTSTNSVLQSPEKVGSMWTTVSARIRGAKTELEDVGLETDGMVESTSKLQSMIKGMTGFDILEADGKTFKSIYDIIVGIGEEFQNLDDIDQAALLEALAGGEYCPKIWKHILMNIFNCKVNLKLYATI